MQHGTGDDRRIGGPQAERWLHALRHGQRAIREASDEAALRQRFCDIVVTDCGYAAAWIEYARPHTAPTAQRVAAAGLRLDGHGGNPNQWVDELANTVRHTGRASGARQTDRAVAGVGHGGGQRLGFAAALAVPLRLDGRVFGVLTACSFEADAICDAEAELLAELAAGLAHGVDALRLRRARVQAKAGHPDGGEGHALLDEVARLQDSVQRSEALFRLLTESTPALVYMHEGPILVYANPSLERTLGYTPGGMVQRPYLTFVHPDDQQRLSEYGLARLAGQPAPDRYEARFLTTDGETRWLELNPVAARWHGRPVVLGTALDVTPRKQVEQENRALIEGLQEALAQVKTLRGILPICSYCKKIRDDQGYWERVESYVSRHTDALFTHGMCPDCFQKAMKELEESQRRTRPDEAEAAAGPTAQRP